MLQVGKDGLYLVLGGLYLGVERGDELVGRLLELSDDGVHHLVGGGTGHRADLCRHVFADLVLDDLHLMAAAGSERGEYRGANDEYQGKGVKQSEQAEDKVRAQLEADGDGEFLGEAVVARNGSGNAAEEEAACHGRYALQGRGVVPGIFLPGQLEGHAIQLGIELLKVALDVEDSGRTLLYDGHERILLPVLLELGDFGREMFAYFGNDGVHLSFSGDEADLACGGKLLEPDGYGVYDVEVAAGGHAPELGL